MRFKMYCADLDDLSRALLILQSYGIKVSSKRKIPALSDSALDNTQVWLVECKCSTPKVLKMLKNDRHVTDQSSGIRPKHLVYKYEGGELC